MDWLDRARALLGERKEEDLPSLPKPDREGRGDGVHYFEYGLSTDSPVTVVFVHGFTLAASAWFMQVEAVAPHARCLAVDLRGHGETGRWPVPECTITGAADDVLTALTHAGVDGPLVFVGHSLGGMVVMNLLRRYPDLRARVQSVVLVSTAVDSIASQGIPQVLALPIVEKIRDAAEASPKDVARFRKRISRLVAPTLATTVFQTPLPASVINFHAKLIHSTPLDTYVGFLDELQSHNEVEGAKALRGIKGVVMVGTRDAVTEPEQSERIAELWGCGLQFARDAGHMLIFEQPALVNKAILSAIR